MAPPRPSAPLLKPSGPQTGVLDQQRRHHLEAYQRCKFSTPQTRWFRDSGVRLATRWKTLSWEF